MKNRIIIIAAAAFVPILGLIPSPFAKNYELKDGTPDDIVQWYRHAFRSDFGTPERPASCCGEADAYWADGVEIEDGEVFAIITDDRQIAGRSDIPVGTRIKVWPQIMDKWHQGNPTGHTIIFIASGGSVICYFPDTGI
jgi:hypothetical protein